ncbi:hypothetical protein A5N71_15540 [Prescottella equi]|nr:hypothetical protein A5N71_15540 [Prescottella equi]
MHPVGLIISFVVQDQQMRDSMSLPVTKMGGIGIPVPPPFDFSRLTDLWFPEEGFPRLDLRANECAMIESPFIACLK